MKNLTDSELINLAYEEIRKMDINFWSQIILCILAITESFLLILGLISVGLFSFFWVLSMGLYVFHYKKSKKSEIKIQEILNELTSREL